MAERPVPDHYEVLQVSPRADHDTIQRVFRHLAKRFHPDNSESGNPARFAQIMEAFQVLSDPAERARYDVRHAQHTRTRWRVFDQHSALSDLESDRRLREAILSILYTVRRNDAERPGVGQMELEDLLQCPDEHMRFHIWYLRENGLIQRTESGALAITATGVDFVLDMGGPVQERMRLLDSGDGSTAARAAG